MGTLRSRPSGRLLLAGLVVGAALAAVVVLLASGSSAPQKVAAIPAHGSTAPAPELMKPTRITIRRIAADSTLIPLGKLSSGAMETPDVHTPQQAGWYARGVVPGHVGPAVVVGHVDGGGRAGVFKRLHELHAGDRAEITRDDGRVLTFEAYRVDQVRKDAFPTEQVYGNTAGPELRLITCGGKFVGGHLGYADNIVVYLRLIGE